jgi:anti-sigma regulatory factor (Ser/Thr protein kinase)
MMFYPPAGVTLGSGGYLGAMSTWNKPAPTPLEQGFDRDGLYAVRAAVSAHAIHLGARPERVRHLVIIASELASNAVRHGGGRGRLRLSTANGWLRCEVSDEGPGIVDPDGVGRRQPPVLAASGRGLWVVRQLSEQVTIECDARGTRVTADVPVD